ncbi:MULTISPECIES: hypothetical protein [unclassified Thioalkalivibrio]|uniref:hypothetical protein n=1 Tax=unclassified Thioalkalivibrio TaxID=2621013 RepID=UPI0012DCFF72|nr:MULTISPECIES: hypothetical protein [unclassified Thioalkalivibrio]
MSAQSKSQKTIFDSSKLRAFGVVFWGPLAVIVLISLFDFSGESAVHRAIQGGSEVVAVWVPLIDTIADTRQDAIGIRIALSAVIVVAPFSLIFFIFRMPRSLCRERVYGATLVRLIWGTFWFWMFFIFVVFSYFYAVLPAADPDRVSGGMTEALDPWFGVPVVAAAFLYFVLYFLSLLTSALFVMLGLLVSDIFGRRSDLS